MPVIPQSQLQEFVTQTLLGVRNGIQAAIDDGLVCLVPKTIDFQVTVVADGELMVAVSRNLNAPNAEAITTTTTEAETEVATTKKEATRKATTTGTESTTGTENGTENTNSADTGEQSGEEEGETASVGEKTDVQTDTTVSTDRDNVRQEQIFGRQSATDVTYTRTD